MDPVSAILSFVSGAGASIFTRIMGYFTRKKEMVHEIELTKLRMAQSKQDHEQELELRAQSFEHEKEINLQKHEFFIDKKELGNLQDTRDNQDKVLPATAGWIEKLNKSFRPVASYFFLFMFMYTRFVYIMNDQCDKAWDEKTEVGFWAIMGFWFTNRVFDRAEKMVAKVKVRT